MPDNKEMAQALLNYPTSEDAQFAKKQDWSYGQPYAPYFEGKRFTHLMGDPNARPLEMHNLNMDRFGQNSAPAINDYYAKAALAANRSPLASLGFDPTRTAADLGRDPRKVNISGMYLPEDDQMYANAQDPSSIVHESMHRGIQKLSESPYWKPEWEGNTKGLFNEYLVRKLMQEKAGDPEGGLGAVDAEQKGRAVDLFKQTKHRKTLDDMESAAALLIAKQRPRGPR